MTILARRLRSLADRPSIATRRLALVVSAVTALTAPLLAAPPVAAKLAKVAGASVGLQPRNSESVRDGLIEQIGGGGFGTPYLIPESFANEEGNPVVHGSDVYVIYWSPKNDYYHDDWQWLIDTFLQGVGAESGSLATVFSVDTQYTDKSNAPARYSTIYRGAYTDTSAYPAKVCTDPAPLQENPVHNIKALGCLTDQQIQQQLQTFITQHALPRGMNAVYYVLTPPGVAVCLDEGGAEGHCSDNAKTAESYENSFCSYHSAINPGKTASGDANTVLYGVIPWTAGGLADGQLAPSDQKSAIECQDGGYDPASRPVIEEKEHLKEESEQEKTEFLKKTKEEKAQIERQHALEGPHQQEPNQAPCPSEDGFCDKGLADLIVNQIAIEQQNIVTDPLLNAWHDSAGNEATDECRNFLAPALLGSPAALEESGAGTLANQTLGERNYYLNDAFDLAALRLNFPGIPCLNGVRLEPRFTSPNPVNAGNVVGFDGMESDISLNAATRFSGGGVPEANYALYRWNFGDGSAEASGYAPGAPPCESPWLTSCAASEFHSYKYGGSYNVTLTVTDVGGHTASVTHTVTVVGPAPPSSEGSGGSASSSSSSSAGSGQGGAGSSPAPAPAVPAPVAAAAVVSRSLAGALHKGLVVRYSVSEQVAGHFEVLLSRTLAHRLGIIGTPALGLPAGSPPELVIAKAILVTTKGGRSTVSIQFSKRTASRLGRLHKVSLLLRLIVRNAASHSPATTTVLSPITLGG